MNVVQNLFMGIMGRIKLSDNLKADLIRVTKDALKDQGLHGLDVRNISQKAGCSVGTFYNHFKNLDDLVIHYNAVSLDVLENMIVGSIDSNDDAKTVIKKICSNYITFAKDNQPEWFLLLEHRIEEPIPTWYQQKVDEFFKKINVIFKSILGGRKRDIETAVKILWGSLHGICSLAMRDKIRSSDGIDPLELSQNLFHNYILGYRVGGLN